MSNTLLVIHSHGKARKLLLELWPWLIIPGWDILGVHAEDEPHTWPDGIKSVAIGKGGRQLPHDHLCKRLVDTFKHLLNKKEFDQYTDFFLTEYDSMFLSKPPAHPGGLFTKRAGGNMPGFKCSQFFHPPWWVDREAAKQIVETGTELVEKGETESGSTDCFLGLIVDRAGIKWSDTGTWTCQNGGDGSDMDTWQRPHLENFLKNGTWFVHGVKTKKNRDLVLELLGNK